MEKLIYLSSRSPQFIPAIFNEALVRTELGLKFTLPEAYVSFLKNNNSGISSNSLSDFEDGLFYGIFTEVQAEDSDFFMLDVLIQTELFGENQGSDGFVVIGETSNQEILCINKSDGSIVQLDEVDVDEEGEPIYGVTKTYGDSFSSFLAKHLRPV